MSEFKVAVTQAHIDSGVQKSGTGCPMALAIREQTPWKEAYVAGCEVSQHGGAFAHSGRMASIDSDAVAEWQAHFDEGGAEAVAPMEFTVQLEVQE